MSEVATYNGMTTEQLMSAMGGYHEGSASGAGNKDRMPILKVNYHDSDDDGNALKKGDFLLTTPDGNAYGKDVTLRVYGDWMQYMQFSDSGLVNKTIVHRVGDIPIDRSGGIRCGKPASKDFNAMMDEEKARFADIKCYRHLYATVTIADAKNSVGDSVEVQDVPCLLSLKGLSFMPFSTDVLEPCRAQRLAFQQVYCKPSTTQRKKGSVTFFTVSFEPDFSKIMTMDTSAYNLMAKFLEVVNLENKQVIKSHNEALYERQEESNDSEVVSEVQDYLDADFKESA